jgi:UDP-glucose 4-epimerase
MRVVVVGATGNVGTSLLQALADDDQVDSVLGVARRLPAVSVAKTEWARADVTSADLTALFRGADVVVHLAWLIQPSRDLARLRHVNVDGSARLFRAVAEAEVPALVYASSLGAYSPGPKDRRVDESWPVEGVPTSFYSRHKAEVERLLDEFERKQPDVRVVRLRPGLIFKREAATGIRRLFMGPLLPSRLVSSGLISFVPDIPGLRVQAVHSLDVGEAYRLAIVGGERGAFNIVADPPLDAALVGRLLGARTVRVTRPIARGAFDLAYRLRLHPSPPGWFDLGVSVPLLDATRAHDELGWQPTRSADDALLELLAGLRESAGAPMPPLDPGTSGRGRARELATRVGGREH